MTTRFTPVDLAAYPVRDILEVLDYEAYLARDQADFLARWNVRRVADPSLPEFDTLSLETEPVGIVLQTGSYRELLLRSRVNDRARALTLAGAFGRALDHIGMTYYRTPRREIVPADGETPAVMEGDEVYRQRLALAPESWSTAGPEGAYIFWALSSSGDVLDVAAYSEDEGCALAPTVRIVALSRTGNGEASADLLGTIRTALRRRDLRPIGDRVLAESAVSTSFDVEVTIRVGGGASAALVRNAAEARIREYCTGRRRWAGEAVEGPVYLIGRTFRQDTIAAAALVGGVEEVEVVTPAADVNAPHASWLTSLPLAENATEPLAAPITAHLFKAPRLGAVTVNVEAAGGIWV